MVSNDDLVITKVKTLEEALTTMDKEQSRAEDERLSDFLDDVPGRDNIMASVGALLYIAASPDILDGLSDSEWEAIEKGGPGIFEAYEKLGRVGLPERFRLPKGFASHFLQEVVPDINIIRGDSIKSAEFRKALREVLHNPKELNKLYRTGGDTYSDIATRVAGTHRSGKFYKPIVSKVEGKIAKLEGSSSARFHYAMRHKRKRGAR